METLERMLKLVELTRSFTLQMSAQGYPVQEVGKARAYSNEQPAAAGG